MNANLLAITNISIGTSAGPCPLRCAETEDTKPFSLGSQRRYFAAGVPLNLTDNPEVPTTYNNTANNTKSDPASSQSSDFSDTFCQKVDRQTPNESEGKAKIKTKGSIRPRRNPVENSAPHQLQSGAGTNRTTEQDPTISGSIGAGASAQESPTAHAVLTNGFATETDLSVVEKEPVSNTKVISEKNLTSPKGSQELMAKVVAPSLADPKQADDAAGSAGQKRPILNYSFPPLQGKSPEIEQKAETPLRGNPASQSSVTGGEKSASLAKKLVDSKSLVKSIDPLIGGLNITKLQISTGQSKDGGSSSPKTGRFSAPVSIESPAGGASNIEFGKFLTWPQAVNTANPPAQVSLTDVYKSISEQIIETIHASLQRVEKQITIHLEPPDLGKVFVKFQEQQDQIIGLLEVSKAEIRYEIEQALPQIIRTLTDYGLQIKRLEVQLADQLESTRGGLDRNELLQDGSLPQSDDGGLAEGGNPDENNANPPAAELANTAEGNYQGNSEPQLIVTGSSINMLV
ncbi:MAG: flagellar hook-length control protein FliK [Sedimentisphaerales bacterium]